MQVTLKYYDNDSLTVEEVVQQAQNNYGKNVKVEIMPDSTIAYDLIYFGLQQLITHEQLSLFYSNSDSYQSDVQKLRSEVLYKVQEIIDQVIMDNESKVT